MIEMDINNLNGIPVGMLKELANGAMEVHREIPECDYKNMLGEFIDAVIAKIDEIEGKKPGVKQNEKRPYPKFSARDKQPSPSADVKLASNQAKIAAACDSIKKFLLTKNKNYGDSALEPTRVCSKANSTEQILIRMDDKINRIANSTEPRMNDYVDLIGYGMLLIVNKGWTDEINKLID
mgnify:CR=1 FL=1